MTLLHAAHVAAAVVWLGGILSLSLVVAPVLRRLLPSAQRIAVLTAVGKRFQPIGWASLGVLGLTGGWMASATLREGVGLLGTPVGRLLIAKGVLFAGIAAVGILHDRVLGPRLVALAERPGATDGPPDAALLAASRRLRTWGIAHLGLSLAAAGVGVWLAHG